MLDIFLNFGNDGGGGDINRIIINKWIWFVLKNFLLKRSLGKIIF